MQKILQHILMEMGVQEIGEIHLEHPANPEHGDWSTNVAMVLFGQKKAPAEFTNPQQFAQAIADKIKQKKDTAFTKVEVAGPGFINLTLSNHSLIEPMLNLAQNATKSIQLSGKNKPVVVEFSSPNIAKPFTIGHVRSTSIGNAVANLLKATGWEVHKDNHLGDWGTQFGKQIYAIKQWGDEKSIENSTQPVHDLVNLYIKFHQEAEKDPTLEEEGRKWFKKLEAGDPEAKRLWQKCIEWSLKEFRKIYQELGIEFDENNGVGYGESFFEDKMGEVIEELKKKKLLQESQGAQVIFFPEEKYPPLMIIKKDGATLYATRDLATDKFRLKKYGPEVTIINEVGIEQSLYFQQLFEVEQMLGWVKPGQRVHIKHGHFRFKDKKMSTRKGNVIWLKDVLIEAKNKAAQFSEEKKEKVDAHHAEVIGIGALKWNDLKRSSALDVIFDWDEILTLQGNSGPYMQYTYARCKSVLAKATQQGLQIDVTKVSSHYKPNAEEKAVLRLLYRFDETIQQAAAEYSPHHLCIYLFEVAQSFNAFYNKCSILGKEGEVDTDSRTFRLALTQATANVIQIGLRILGIETLEKM